MKKNNSIYLQDILLAISYIEEYCHGIQMKDFLNDRMRQDAVLRRFEIIGEAAGKLGQGFRKRYPEFPFRQAKSMRNLLIHNYDQVDLREVWKTLKKDLPILKKALETILNK